MTQAERDTVTQGICDNPRVHANIVSCLQHTGASLAQGGVPGPSNCNTFLAEVLGTLTINYRPSLPISIDHQLPHIRLEFGNDALDDSIRPGIFGIVDSGASLSLGNMGFWTGIFPVYPHIVMSTDIASTDGFPPIRLTVVVKSDGTSDAAAELPVVYTLKLPYKHRSNNQLTYLKIACEASV